MNDIIQKQMDFLFEQGKKAGQRQALPDIYRDSHDYDEYMQNAIDEGYDSEEADVIWHELNHKYSN